MSLNKFFEYLHFSNFKMVLKRSKGYQDIDDKNGFLPSTSLSMDTHNMPQEIEMASVSVVPDDTFTVTQAVNALGFGWFQVKLSLWTGLCWMADSMEMTILSILSPALHCDWQISRVAATEESKHNLSKCQTSRYIYKISVSCHVMRYATQVAATCNITGNLVF